MRDGWLEWDPTELPAHLHATGDLPEPREGRPEDFVTALLVPARTGMILPRTMPGHATRELSLGVRIGERRCVLAHLLDQAPAPLLAWLAQRAAQSAERPSTTLVWTGPPAASWHDRATAALLANLADDANTAVSAATGSGGLGKSR